MTKFNVYVNGSLEYKNVPSQSLEELVFSIITQHYGEPLTITWEPADPTNGEFQWIK